MKFEQEVLFDRGCAEIYDILTNDERFSTITSAPAQIRPNVGGSYSVYGGMFTGIITSLEPCKKIVMYWRKKEWHEVDKSKVTITLTVRDGKTHLHLLQEEIPDHFLEKTSKIWKEYYWDIMEGKVL